MNSNINTYNTPQKEKIVFQFILENNLIKEVPAEYFFNNDIKTIYKIIESYHRKFNKVPSKEQLWIESQSEQPEGFNISETLFDKIYERNGYNSLDKDVILKTFEDWKLVNDQINETSKRIDIVRSHDANKIRKELGLTENSDDEYKIPDDILFQSPVIPDEVYNTIPKFLKNCIKVFETNREKDVLFLSQMVILSNLFPNYKSTHDRKTIFPNLYGLIVAPPSNGKGVMNHANESLILIKKQFENEYTEKRKDYLKNKKLYIDEPIYQNINLSSNLSKSSMIKQLYNNCGNGIIFSSEINSLLSNWKLEWGDIEHILNLCFHHEQVDTLRNETRIEIDTPKLSLLFSGPFHHCVNFIKSTESGLFSRFFYYCFKGEKKWNIAPDSDTTNNTDYFKVNIASQLLTIFNELKDIQYTFKFTDEQFQLYNNYFSEAYDYTTTHKDEDADSMIKRIAVIFRRFCMIFTLLREFENKNRMFNNNTKLICNEVDFNNTMKIIQTLQKHSEIMYDNLNKVNINNVVSDPKLKIFESMNNIFKRGDFVDKWKETSLSKVTMDRYLKSLLDRRYIKKVDHYNFEKIK